MKKILHDDNGIFFPIFQNEFNARCHVVCPRHPTKKNPNLGWMQASARSRFLGFVLSLGQHVKEGKRETEQQEHQGGIQLKPSRAQAAKNQRPLGPRHEVPLNINHNHHYLKVFSRTCRCNRKHLAFVHPSPTSCKDPEQTGSPSRAPPASSSSQHPASPLRGPTWGAQKGLTG